MVERGTVATVAAGQQVMVETGTLATVAPEAA